MRSSRHDGSPEGRERNRPGSCPPGNGLPQPGLALTPRRATGRPFPWGAPGAGPIDAYRAKVKGSGRGPKVELEGALEPFGNPSRPHWHHGGGPGPSSPKLSYSPQEPGQVVSRPGLLLAAPGWPGQGGPRFPRAELNLPVGNENSGPTFGGPPPPVSPPRPFPPRPRPGPVPPGWPPVETESGPPRRKGGRAGPPLRRERPWSTEGFSRVSMGPQPVGRGRNRSRRSEKRPASGPFCLALESVPNWTDRAGLAPKIHRWPPRRRNPGLEDRGPRGAFFRRLMSAVCFSAPRPWGLELSAARALGPVNLASWQGPAG